MKKEKIVNLAIAGAVAMTLGASKDAFAVKPGYEKCAGIAKAGKNDCGANGHACGGKAAKDGDPNEWIALPAGLCEKIVGGKVIKSNMKADAKMKAGHEMDKAKMKAKKKYKGSSDK